MISSHREIDLKFEDTLGAEQSKPGDNECLESYLTMIFDQPHPTEPVPLATPTLPTTSHVKVEENMTPPQSSAEVSDSELSSGDEGSGDEDENAEEATGSDVVNDKDDIKVNMDEDSVYNWLLSRDCVKDLVRTAEGARQLRALCVFSCQITALRQSERHYMCRMLLLSCLPKSCIHIFNQQDDEKKRRIHMRHTLLGIQLDTQTWRRLTGCGKKMTANIIRDIRSSNFFGKSKAGGFRQRSTNKKSTSGAISAGKRGVRKGK